MADSRASIDALLTEHFRYTPLSLIDDIINTVNAIIYRAVEAIENGLLSTPPQALGFADDPSPDISIPDADGERNVDFPEARAEIENGVHQLETLLEATVDKLFDKFEIYTLRNILTVPDDLTPWVRLAHYGDLTLPLPASAPTPASVLALRRKLQETNKLNLALEHEHACNTALLSELHALIGHPSKAKGEDEAKSSPPDPAPLSFLAPHMAGAPSQPLSTSAQFTASQLPALRTLVAELRPKLTSLPSAAERVDWDSGKEQRREYIDGVVRRVVSENGVGEESGERDLGRTVAGEEVRDLEGVVQAMGSGGEDVMEG
ncbi:hypothetical protein MMC26_005189 [Xylographa opegraphella]|nr:hypothetical protein [Xylographa opegraphella]